GSSGFLGGRLVEILATAGVPVRVLARPTAKLDHLAALPLEVIRGGFCEPEVLRRAVSGVSHIYHCAGCSTDWAPWRRFQEANVQGVRALLDAVRDSSTLARFLHVSTSDVYGYPPAPCNEDGPTVDTGLPYNRSKREGENLVWRASAEWGLPVTIVRPASIYGPRGTAFTLDFARHI
ncbi:MAG: NAD-dependent epimerase/dehydratase family protein, partial [Acidobacteria bacterium]|nr:NAD-dependent epimerase/dehydratase family protein [Acidobacteriota bacterium]